MLTEDQSEQVRMFNMARCFFVVFYRICLCHLMGFRNE